MDNNNVEPNVTLKGSIKIQNGLTGHIHTGSSTLSGKVNIPSSIQLEVYSGEYEITPKADSEVILETKNKKMAQNVTVQKVPYFETSNTDGTTVYIACEV